MPSSTCYRRAWKQAPRFVLCVGLVVLAVQQLLPVLHFHIQVTLDGDGEDGDAGSLPGSMEAEGEEQEEHEEQEAQEEQEGHGEADEDEPDRPPTRGRQRRPPSARSPDPPDLPEGGARQHKAAQRPPSGDGLPGQKVPRTPEVGVVHLLFTVQDSLPHAAVWRAFLAKAPSDAWRAWLHCVDYKACQQRNISNELPGMVLVSTVNSQRCTDLVSPQWKLVQTAIKAYPKAAPGATDKFLLLSGTCLPIKPFGIIHKEFTSSRNDESDFCLMDPKKEWQKTIVNGINFYLVKHSQWAVLSRRHAEQFAKRWKGLDKSGRWSFAMPAKKFSKARFFLDRKDKHNWRCADEFALFATIFGLYVPGQHGLDDCPLNSRTQCKSAQLLMAQSRCRTMYFFYKTDDSDVLRALNKESGTKLAWRGDGHPAEFTAVSSKTWRLLRSSPHFFARKFHPEAQLSPDYGEALFSEKDPAQGHHSSSAKKDAR